MELVSTVEAPGCLAVAFRQKGRQVGHLQTPLGDVRPTGRSFDVLSIDILSIEGGLISEIWVVADELGRLLQLEALALSDEPEDPPAPMDQRTVSQ